MANSVLAFIISDRTDSHFRLSHMTSPSLRGWRNAILCVWEDPGLLGKTAAVHLCIFCLKSVHSTSTIVSLLPERQTEGKWVLINFGFRLPYGLIGRTESLVNHKHFLWLSGLRPLLEEGQGHRVISLRSIACFVSLYGDNMIENLSPSKCDQRNSFIFIPSQSQRKLPYVPTS